MTSTVYPHDLRRLQATGSVAGRLQRDDRVQAAFLDDGIVALRDSKNPDKPAHRFTDSEYDMFVDGIMLGAASAPLARACN